MLVLVSQDYSSFIVFSKRRPVTSYTLWDVVENATQRPTFARGETMTDSAMQTALFTLAGRGWMTQHYPDPRGKRPHEATEAPPRP